MILFTSQPFLMFCVIVQRNWHPVTGQRKCHTMNNKVTFSMDEIRKLEVINKVESKQLTGKEAAKWLRLSERQVRRLIARYRGQGPPGLVHGNRGRVAISYGDSSGIRQYRWADRFREDHVSGLVLSHIAQDGMLSQNRRFFLRKFLPQHLNLIDIIYTLLV